MADLETYVENVRLRVRESNNSPANDMGDSAYQDFVRSAINRYSIDRPRHIVSESTGTGQKYYTVSTILPSFVEGFSRITHIEAIGAIVANKELPNYIERDDWDYYRDSVGLRLLFKRHQPDTSETIRIEYTVLHTINKLDSATEDTIPVFDVPAIYYYAASEALKSLAAKYTSVNDPTIRADIVNYRSKSRESSERAKDYLTEYENWLKETDIPISVTRQIETGFSFGIEQPFLTHKTNL